MKHVLHSTLDAESDNVKGITGGLKGVALADGRTVWVCDDCMECLRRGRPIQEDWVSSSQYQSLVLKKTKTEVTLQNLTSVTILTESLRNNTDVQS